MAVTCESRTLSVRIDRSPSEIYDFVSLPQNLPQWATGIGTSLELVDGKWIANTSRGPVHVRFAARNAFGVLDHFVSTAAGVEVYIPMRVIANGSGSEVIFTLLRSVGMSDARFAEDATWVERDLAALKRLLEE